MAIKASYKPRILIADDQPDVLTALRLLLKSEGFDSLTVGSGEEVLSRLAAEPFNVVLLDMNYSRDTTSGQEGLELVAKIKQSAPRVSVIVMTAWATIDLAVEAVQRGASDFLQKPWDNRRLLAGRPALRPRQFGNIAVCSKGGMRNAIVRARSSRVVSRFTML